MLNPQEAEKRMAAVSVPEKDRTARNLAAIVALPEELRPTAYALIDRDGQGEWYGNRYDQESRDKRQAIQKAAAEHLDRMNLDERTAVLSALLPKMGRALALYWNFGQDLYQAGHQRRAFRIKDRPELSRNNRFSSLYGMVSNLSQYREQDIVWLATFAGYAGYWADAYGRLFASLIDGGGPEADEVFEVLLASARGEHEEGAMGRHVTRALLCASRPDGWTFVEKLLIAAQRQEGLRQQILEAIDEGHPEAFRRMLKILVEHEMMRFSATIRAVDVWFALGWDAPSLKQANHALNMAYDFVFDADAREKAITGSDDGPTVYMALWAIAFEDVLAAVERAKAVLTDSMPLRRAAAVHLLTHLGLAEARQALVPLIDDPDLRVAAMAFRGTNPSGYFSYYYAQTKDTELEGTDFFERLERNIPRFPAEPKQFDPFLFPWVTPIAHAAELADTLGRVRGSRELSRLLPFLPVMSAGGRQGVASAYADKDLPLGDQRRDVLIGFLSDASDGVRTHAMEGLKRYPADDTVIIAQYEKMLSRKSPALRRSLIELLMKQNDTQALASADRLLEAKAEPQRVAGLGLIDEMLKAKRQPEKVRERAKAFVAKRASLSEAESALTDKILTVDDEKPTLDNALGLMNPANISKGAPPHKPAHEVVFATDTPAAILKALDDWVEERRQTPIRVQHYSGETEMLLADTHHSFPMPNNTLALEEDLARLPLRAELEAFWQNRPASLRDPDGFELLRLELAQNSANGYAWGDSNPKFVREFWREFTPLTGGIKYRHDIVVSRLVYWLRRMDEASDTSAAKFLLDAADASLAQVVELEAYIAAEQAKAKGEGKSQDEAKEPTGFVSRLMGRLQTFVGAGGNVADTQAAMAEMIARLEDAETPGDDEDEKKDKTIAKKIKGYTPGNWRHTARLRSWLTLAEGHSSRCPDAWPDELRTRLWNLQAWVAQPHPDALRQRPEFAPIAAAFRIGAANVDDIYDALLGPRVTSSNRYYGHANFNDLKALTARKSHPYLESIPALKEIVNKCRRRVLEVEIKRGDNPTVATEAARALSYTGGLDVLFRFVKAMGKESFARGYSYYGGDNRANVFSQIIRSTFPGADDTPAVFAERAKSENLPQKKLVEVAMYAPQWANHVEAALGWDSFAEGVWWMHAHTRDNQWSVAADLREAWKAEMADKTPLTADDLLEGGVDVAWFHRIHAALGTDRWQMLDDAAKFASSAGGHKRAQLYADAMLGKAQKDDLVKRIQEKRNQDAVRALGLLPVPAELDEKQDETLVRYAVIQEFLRGSKQFGAQRQESEKKAARIGLENLARTCGYPDPVRLEWAMEARAIADLAAGPITVTSNDVSVTLSINALGEPDLVATKKGKVLANLPPKAKKDEAITALVSRRKEIERQASRMRGSLEEAMIRGDVFTGAELVKLFEHPVLQPMLRSLVFIEDAGAEPILGYAMDDGRTLEDCEGETYPISPDLRLRLSHPYDLLQTGKWDRWQRDCFLRERIQPFKQVFRELYVLTEQERTDASFSARYSGHQVNPKQALALLGKRGWVNSYESGSRKTYHQAGISAYLDSVGTTFTPLDVEGFTIDDIRFYRRGEWKPLPLTEVPARLFSETMRDLDLVVSVAHMGGVDPEASASTVEMRAALVREAAGLLKLGNVRIEKSHVLVDGKLAQYSIHLGSAIVHRQPGGFVCIVPSHAQHRGRLFLPFADDDPRTAEVVSKVLLLAKDNEIKDPTILEQLLVAR